MTPERLERIRAEFRDYQLQHGRPTGQLFNDAIDLLTYVDTLTAENDRLKGEVERLTKEPDRADAILEQEGQRAYDAGNADGYKDGFDRGRDERR